MRRLPGIGICALLAFALVLPATASAAKTKAKVTVKGWSPGALPPAGEWTGRVKSEKNKCQKNRDVQLYMRQGKDNLLLGNDATEKVGKKWIWQIPGELPDDGEYFALIAPTDDCARAESKIFTYPDDNPPPRTI